MVNLLKMCWVLFTIGLLKIVNGQTCKALSLEGGGSWGAYEAGAIWALANMTKPGDIQWNVISGISAGALNTGALVQFPMGQEVAMSEFLLGVWNSLQNNSQIFVEWKGGLIDGLLFQRGLYNTDPLEKLVRTNFIYPIQRNFSVGSTNLDTGMLNTFNNSIGNAAIDAVMCSSAIPFVFPPHIFEGYAMADGGCIMNQDVFSAIGRCLEIATEPNIIVDMIYDTPYAGLGNDTKFKTLDVFSRTYDIIKYDSSVWYTYNAMVAYPQAHFRYLIHPSTSFPGGLPLNFTQYNIQFEIQTGINDTIHALNLPKDSRTFIKNLYEKNFPIVLFP